MLHFFHNNYYTIVIKHTFLNDLYKSQICVIRGYCIACIALPASLFSVQNTVIPDLYDAGIVT